MYGTASGVLHDLSLWATATLPMRLATAFWVKTGGVDADRDQRRAHRVAGVEVRPPPRARKSPPDGGILPVRPGRRDAYIRMRPEDRLSPPRRPGVPCVPYPIR